MLLKGSGNFGNKINFGDGDYVYIGEHEADDRLTVRATTYRILGNTTEIATASSSGFAFSGTPTAPTAAAGTNTTQIATTAFVTTAVANAGGGGVVNTVTAGTGLTGGGSAATVTVSMANMAARTVKGNNTANSAAPIDLGASALMELIASGSTTANNTSYVLRRGASATVWTIVAETAGGGSGTVTQVTAGTGLTGGNITTSGTIAVSFGSPVALSGTSTSNGTNDTVARSNHQHGLPGSVVPRGDTTAAGDYIRFVRCTAATLPTTRYADTVYFVT